MNKYTDTREKAGDEKEIEFVIDKRCVIEKRGQKYI